MRGTVRGFALVAGVVLGMGTAAGCGGAGGTPTEEASGSMIPTVPSSSPPPSTPSSSGDGTSTTTDLGSCADGACRVQVREGDVLRFDESLGVRQLTITRVDDDLVGVEARTGPNSRSSQTSNPGSQNILNGIAYEVVSVDDGVATMEIDRS